MAAADCRGVAEVTVPFERMDPMPNTRLTRRELLARAGGLALAFTGVPRLFGALRPGPEIVVYKDPSCGCCAKWVEHMREHGFTTSVRDVADLPRIKARYKVPRAFESCHTAVVQGYVVEGHVPADVVLKFLAEKPKVTGLAVPGMPIGSPGMEGSPKQAYEVLTFDTAGKTTVYAKR